MPAFPDENPLLFTALVALPLQRCSTNARLEGGSRSTDAGSPQLPLAANSCALAREQDQRYGQFNVFQYRKLYIIELHQLTKRDRR